MYAFNYHKPATLDEAKALYADCEDPYFVAGGHTLLPTMKQRLVSPTDLIDLAGIEDLAGISIDGDELVIGAMTTHGEVAASSIVADFSPGLAQLAGKIGDTQVRNRGTIGGSVANSDPAADYPAGLLGSGATIVTDQRQIAVDDFFIDLFETALQEGEMIRSVRFPGVSRSAYQKFDNPASRYAIVGVFVSEGKGGVRVAVTGAGATVFRNSDMEQALAADFSAAALDSINVSSDDFNSDLHASPEYRAALVKEMAKRAVASI